MSSGCILSNVSVLFVREDSIYKTLAGCDCYDVKRDARSFDGLGPVIAHPPCRTWGNLRTMATSAPADEKELAPWAIAQVRHCGGVLEHPAGSKLFNYCGCGTIAEPDEWGGWRLLVDQYHWGHRASKPTRLYIVGCSYASLPPIPHRIGIPTHCITQGHGVRIGHTKFKPRVPQWERETTPKAFAEWLVAVARSCHEQ